jgi:peptidyl-prolyl cis-trans isomerase D
MAKKTTAARNIAGTILLVLLVVGLAGFGVDGFGGTVRSVGKVGDREISTTDYAQALNQGIRAFSEQVGQTVSFELAQAFGIDRTVRAQLVTRAALDNETGVLGISVGDEVVQRELLNVPAFRGPGGSFSRDSYSFALQNAGLSETEFENQLREDAARGILQGAIAAGITAPEIATDTMLNYVGQNRDFTVLSLDASDLEAPIEAPDDAALTAYYDANIADFTLGTAKRLTYAWITPEMLFDTVEIDEQVLRDAYQDRISEFVIPERRLVERLVYPTLEAAQAALDRAAAGEVDFSDLVVERGLTLEDADMGDVTQAELGAAGATVFALAEPGLTGPFTTAIGPAIFRMNAVIAARETTYEDAVSTLRDEVAADRARRVISDNIESYEDLLAGGATIEDLANETDLVLGQTDWRAADSDGIAGYTEFRAAAESAAESDFAELLLLEDGGIFALRLDEIVDAAPKPFEDVRAEVIAGWQAAETLARLQVQAAALQAQLATGADFESLNLAPNMFQRMTRTDVVPNLPREILTVVFSGDIGSVELVPGVNRVHLVRVDAITDPDLGTEEVQQLRAALADQIAQGTTQDTFGYFSRALESEAGIYMDEAAITAVNNSFSTGG